MNSELETSNVQAGNLSDSQIEFISFKINKDIYKYLPAISNIVKQNMMMEVKVEEFSRMVTEIKEDYVSSGLFQKTNFIVNKIQQEVDYLKNFFSKEKVASIDQCISSISQFESDIKLIGVDMTYKANKADFKECMEQFSLYATTAQLGQLQVKMDDFVTYDQMIDIRNFQRKMTNEFNDLDSQKNQIIQQIDKMNLDLQLKAPSSLLKTMQKSLNEQMNDIEGKIESFEGHQTDINKDYEKDINHLLNEIQNLKKELNLKLGFKDKADLKEQIKECALVNDLKDLYGKTLPQIRNFEKKIKEFDIQAQQTKIIVSRFDEVLAEKANRQTVLEQFQECDNKYANSTKQDWFIDRVEEQIKEMQKQLSEQLKLLEHAQISLQNKIKSEIKKAKQELKPSSFEEMSKNENQGPSSVALGASEQFRYLLDKKADRSDVQELFNQKSCKNDTEMALRWIQIIHRQLKQVVVLMTEKFRNSIENHGDLEQKNKKMTRKVNLLHQALVIFKWVQESQTPHIRDAFEIETKDHNMKVPQEIQKWEQQIKNEIKKIEKIKYSPTQSPINGHIQNSYQQIYGKRADTQIKNYSDIQVSRLKVNRPSVPQSVMSDINSLKKNIDKESQDFLLMGHFKEIRQKSGRKQRKSSMNQTLNPILSPKSRLTQKIVQQKDYFAQQLQTDQASTADELMINSVTPSKVIFSNTISGEGAFPFPKNSENSQLNGKNIQFITNFKMMQKTAQNFQKSIL